MTVLDWLDSLQASGIRPGLGRMRTMLRALGRPHVAYPSIIVAGTNGKGSTSATLTSILNASGYRTGLYTSPHLVELRERWMIGGAMISEAALDASINALRDAADRVSITPTYFEALTLIAFDAFARAKCDVVVLEVGMGGRLDATNVVKPIASLITPIGFDHMEYLGNTLRKIAAEKAGVIHRGAIVLTSNREPIVIDVLRRRAQKFGNAFHVVHGDESTVTPLAGAFQRDNIALAARTARELAPQFPGITEESIARGIATTQWRGRLEHLRIGDKDVWIDGCHNAHAAIAVAPYIAETLPRPRTFVFGIMSDKDVCDVGRALYPLFDRVIATEPYPPRSADAETLAARARSRGIEAIAEKDPRKAIELALASNTRSIFIGGSLYLAGAAIDFFAVRSGHDDDQ
ncbi:MAG TPA: folylpolyglutamate synthase/dihydrofolate synthase family protein [Thermoanaerobaculia bacterium]|nr:folylpolyglutamate synthase/dihydrofolate synthase family protein [Thermoanaerobaculia bacterium]